MSDRNCQAKKIPMKWAIFVISCQNDMICYYRKIHSMVIMVMVILVKIDIGLGHLLTIYKWRF